MRRKVIVRFSGVIHSIEGQTAYTTLTDQKTQEEYIATFKITGLFPKGRPRWCNRFTIIIYKMPDGSTSTVVRRKNRPSKEVSKANYERTLALFRGMTCKDDE